MYIKGFGIRRLPPLEHIAHIDCDARVNMFIGPNATGKTTILRAINAFYSQGHEERPGPETVYLGREGSNGSIYLEPSDDWPRDPSLPFPDNISLVKWGIVPMLFIPATRVSLPVRSMRDDTVYECTGINPDHPLKRLFETEPGIFYGQYVELATDWLRDFMSGPRNSVNQLVQFRRAVEIAHACAMQICNEVISDDRPYPFVELDDGSSKGRTVHYGMGISTTDDFLGEPLYAGVLSSGTQGTLLWIWALSLKIVNHYRWKEDWQKKPAILLIDEIENHLHPTWQRRVIPALLEHFPGLQIFATTHSPFVVAGREAGQVHLLKRDENTGVVSATTNTEDIIGWTADEILRTMMGVDDPTDDATAAAARELRRLRQEGPRDTLEAEEQRQQRMTELRQLVDHDLLAGGPDKARREQFEEEFADALEQYLKSKELNQDSG